MLQLETVCDLVLCLRASPGAYPRGGSTTWVGSSLTCKHQTRLERLVRDKGSSLFGPWKDFACKVWGLPYREGIASLVGTSLTCKHYTKLESYSQTLDQAGKAWQGQTLQLIWSQHGYEVKSSFDIGPSYVEMSYPTTKNGQTHLQGRLFSQKNL